MQRVHFVAPVSNTDLRVVLSNATRNGGKDWGVAYRTAYGETREILWLSEAEANARAKALRERGYRVVAGPMD